MDINVTQLGRNSIPVRGVCPGVFFLFQDNELVFIGHSWNCFLGVAEKTRKENPKTFNRWSYIQVDDEIERATLARTLIAKHRLSSTSS